MLNIAAFNVDIYGILRNLIEFILLPCFPNLLCLRSQIWKRVILFGYDRISAMQINRFTEIGVFDTSLGFTFLRCIALF